MSQNYIEKSRLKLYLAQFAQLSTATTHRFFSTARFKRSALLLKKLCYDWGSVGDQDLKQYKKGHEVKVTVLAARWLSALEGISLAEPFHCS